MVKVANFDESLEKDFARLTSEIEEQRRAQEVESMPMSNRELVRQTLESMTAREAVPTPQEEKIVPPSPSPVQHAPVQVSSPDDSYLPNYLRGENVDQNAKREVNMLVRMALQKGLSLTIQEVKKHSPFVQDAFHDALVEVLLPELERRGIV